MKLAAKLCLAVFLLAGISDSRAQNAPSPFAGDYLTVSIVSGSAPFAFSGKYRVFLSPVGTNYYMLGHAGTGFGAGTYSYVQLNGNTAQATLLDSQFGPGITMQLSFSSLTNGTITLLNATGGQSGNFTVSSYATLAPASLVFPVTSNGLFQASVGGQPGFAYAVESTSNLTAWATITNLSLTDISGNFSHPVTNSQAFYRARVTATQFAPASLTNTTFNATVTEGATPLVANGIFERTTDTNGNGYHVIGGGGISNSIGIYTYARTGPDSGTINTVDSVFGPLTEQLYFTSPNGGYFSRTNGASASQFGQFSLGNGALDFIGNLSIVPDNARSRSLYYPADGTPATLSVSNADGWIWSLSISSNALLTPRTITMIPTANVSSGDSFLIVTNGVQLEPDGLQFSDAVTLTVTPPAPLGPHGALLMAGDDGSALYFVNNNTNTITNGGTTTVSYSTTIYHFTMAGVTDMDDGGWAAYADAHAPQAIAAYNQAVADVKALERVVTAPPEPPDYDLTCDPNSTAAADAAIDGYLSNLFAREDAAAKRLFSAAMLAETYTGSQFYEDDSFEQYYLLIETSEFRKVDALIKGYSANPLKAIALMRVALNVEQKDSHGNTDDQLENGRWAAQINKMALSLRDYYYNKLHDEHDYSLLYVCFRAERIASFINATDIENDGFIDKVANCMSFTLTLDNKLVAQGQGVEASGTVRLFATPKTIVPLTGSGHIDYLPDTFAETILVPGQSFIENVTIDNVDVCKGLTADIHLDRFGADMETYTFSGVTVSIVGNLQSASTALFFQNKQMDGTYVFHLNLQNKDPQIVNQVFSGGSGSITLTLQLDHTPL